MARSKEETTLGGGEGEREQEIEEESETVFSAPRIGAARLRGKIVRRRT